MKKLILIAAVVLMTACRTTKIVPVIETRTDTLIITKHQRDSVWLHDSIHVIERRDGDTVWLLQERWHTKYIEKQVHDTTYISKTDSVPVPYPIEVEVPAELTWWQQTRLHLANITLWLLLIVGIGWLVRKKLF